jgi:urease accessory protein
MDLAEPITTTWQARLALGFERRGAATILSRREHTGPLRIQKPLYPEGEAVCHAIVLHPPSGIVGGDELTLEATVGAHGHALLTTPGAGKWYRSAGEWARQRLLFEVAEAGVLEWLPQETIVFDGARSEMHGEINLAADAGFIGMEILCLGRRASGESFASGALRLENRVRRNGRPIWLERGRIEGGSDLLTSPVGLAGYTVSGTLLATAPGLDAGLNQACRAIASHEPGAHHGVTQTPEILVARYLGHSSEAARRWFVDLWRVLRPALVGRAAHVPRIWNT